MTMHKHIIHNLSPSDEKYAVVAQYNTLVASKKLGGITLSQKLQLLAEKNATLDEMLIEIKE